MLEFLAWVLLQPWLFTWIVAGVPAVALAWLIMRRWRRWWVTALVFVGAIPFAATCAAAAMAAALFIVAQIGWMPFPPKEIAGWMSAVMRWGMSWGAISVAIARLIIWGSEPEGPNERRIHRPGRPTGTG